MDAWQAWATGGLILAMVGVLAHGRFGADIVTFGVLLALLLLGIVEPREAVAGFANPAVITVAMLYIVATAVRETGATNLIARRLIGRPKRELAAQARMVVPVAALSAFVNNTPIVAMFLPALDGLAKRTGIAPGRLFMPLSFASILGGVCTLIGTSTTVIVAGLLTSYVHEHPELYPGGDGPAFSMFTLAWVGVPIAVAGVVYILLAGRSLLPARRPDGEDADHAPGGYHASLRVCAGSPVIGKTVEQAGLRHLRGLFLSRVDRDESSVVPGPNFIVEAGDVLVFVGALESVVDLQQIRGLEPAGDEQSTDYRPNLRLYEGVVASRSALVGRTIREAGIRTRYGAAVVAVRRQGEPITGKLGAIRLRAGDTLLMEAPRGAGARFVAGEDFYLATERESPAALRHDRAWVALAIVGLLVVTITLGWLPPMVAAMAAAGAMILTRCCTGPQARSGVDFQVLAVIGSAFGIGAALQNTGLASDIASAVVAWLDPLGPRALLAGVYVLTVVFSMVMTNNAAAVLMFPIAASVANAAGLDLMPFAVVIAVAASCEFSTPIGYQTNLMVMGPGGYKWLDYTRFGGPLNVLCGVICIALTPAVFPF